MELTQWKVTSVPLRNKCKYSSLAGVCSSIFVAHVFPIWNCDVCIISEYSVNLYISLCECEYGAANTAFCVNKIESEESWMHPSTWHVIQIKQHERLMLDQWIKHKFPRREITFLSSLILCILYTLRTINILQMLHPIIAWSGEWWWIVPSVHWDLFKNLAAWLLSLLEETGTEVTLFHWKKKKGYC